MKYYKHTTKKEKYTNILKIDILEIEKPTPKKVKLDDGYSWTYDFRGTTVWCETQEQVENAICADLILNGFTPKKEIAIKRAQEELKLRNSKQLIYSGKNKTPDKAIEIIQRQILAIK